MRYGICNAAKVEPHPGGRAECPSCGSQLIAKCGEIVAWHWAHEIGFDCDAWSEGETDWHIKWKECFPIGCREVVIGPHRADVLTERGIVIELQHSAIASDEIFLREQFYKQMVWVFDCGDVTCDRLLLRKRNGFVSFRWKHPRKSLWKCTKPVFLDLDIDIWDGEQTEGGTLFEVKKIHHSTPCGGWGNVISKTDFVSRFS